MLTEDQAHVVARMTVPQLTATVGYALQERDLDLVRVCLVRIEDLDAAAGARVRQAIVVAAGRLAS